MNIPEIPIDANILSISINFQCDYPDLVPECDAEAFLQFSCPAETQVEGFGPGETKFYKSDDCQRFFLCNNGRPRLNVCGVGAAFDDALNRCENAKNVAGCEHLAIKEEDEEVEQFNKPSRIIKVETIKRRL